MSVTSQTEVGFRPVSGGIRSRSRVRDLGEVFTAHREIDGMIDLIGDLPVDATYLEPACGNGNFLVVILARKVGGIEAETEDETTTVHPSIRLLQAVATISAIDISPANVDETHVRMLQHAIGWHTYLTGFEPSRAWATVCYYILCHKIIVGDFLERTGTLHDVRVSDDGVVTVDPHELVGLFG